MKITQGKVATLSLDVLAPNDIQPNVRTTDSALKGLTKEISSTTIIIHPVILMVGRRYIVLDGHRRIAAAKALGLTELDCIVISGDVDAAELFVALNKELRKFSSSEWFLIWANSTARAGILKKFPKKQADHIRNIIDWVGKDGAETMANGGYSPSIATVVEKVLRLMTHFPSAYANEAHLTGAEVMRWLIATNGQNDVTRYISKEVTNAAGGSARTAVRRLFRACRKNKAIFETIRANRELDAA